MDKPPTDPADHARQFAQLWADKLEEHCTIRMQELGIPDDMNGQPDYGRDGKWRAFDWRDGEGGRNTTTRPRSSAFRSKPLFVTL
jgi:hypothetical protein